ncbi:MAG: polysaccharide biosynthesis tyrosine autokinase [Methylacidiphilales bacterium]|nr:polysaccharide biosynthesis tyrosine autokinase [Candidatus Methylacidiphilales bacterium]NJR17815.1 polysaccharide biosynthesis tyrosine autokinase [Calothrix sp. CSU_2_0]
MEKQSHPDDLDLHNYWLVLKRRWLIVSGIFLTSIALSGFAISQQRPTYEAEGKLLFEANRTNSLTGVGEKFRDLESIRREANPLSTQAVILQSRPILQAVVEKLNLRDRRGKLIDPKSLVFKVEPVAGTDVLNVSFISENPQEAAAIVNHLMQSYVSNNVRNNRSEALAARMFIETQLLPRAKGELDKTAEELRGFKEQNQIINLEQESNETVKTIGELDKQLNETRSQLAEVTSQQAELRSQVKIKSDRAVDVASLSLIPGVQEVLGELQKVQTKLATERSRYTSTHPSIANLKEQEKTLTSLLEQRVSQSVGSKNNLKIAPNALQLGALKEQLVGESVRLQAQRLGFENKVQTLGYLYQQYKKRANVLPNLEKKQGDLERRLVVAQESYKQLLTRLQEVRVVENQNVGSARIVQDAAVSNQPVRSKLTMYLAAGGVFVGLMLGIAAAFLIDVVDRSIKTIKEAESIFGYTLLGLIPKFETSNNGNERILIEGASPRVIVATLPRSRIHESYQMLQANLNFISHKKVRTIAIASSVASEGKSEVAANLAAVMAQAGKRVLIVDADMRNPTQHHLWGVMNLTGLSNVIVGQEQIRRCIQPITRNLSVLTAGVIPPNPLALLDSESMSALIKALSASYDYIVFDTPPLAGTADAAVLGKMVDGVLVVVRPGVADTASASATKSLLVRSEANVLGIVANGVNVKHEPDGYFYHNNARTESGGQQLVSQSVISDKK